jgi:hypothetical protein
MATLYITELQRLGDDDRSVAQIADLASVVTQQAITISASSAQSAAFNALTRYIRVHTDTTCWLSTATANPTATTSMIKLPADGTEYFGVSPSLKIAAITL